MSERQSLGEQHLDTDPAAALRLIRQQQRDFGNRMGGFVPTILVGWGLAYILGFGALWLVDAAGLPFAVALAILIAVVVIAAGMSTVLGIRGARGVRSSTATETTGTIYGLTWMVGMIAVGAIGGALGLHGMSGELQSVYFASGFSGFVGIMYLAAGAVWNAIPAALLGAWAVLVAIAAAFVGFPNHYAVIAIGTGLAFVGLGIAQAVRARRGRLA